MMEQIASGNFTSTRTSSEGAVVVDVRTYGDRRVCFMDTYKRPDFAADGIAFDFVQARALRLGPAASNA
jgi:dTDP-4-dehydrorhamnose 3,5-epimerase-like enzyme